MSTVAFFKRKTGRLLGLKIFHGPGANQAITAEALLAASKVAPPAAPYRRHRLARSAPRRRRCHRRFPPRGTAARIYDRAGLDPYSRLKWLWCKLSQPTQRSAQEHYVHCITRRRFFQFEVGR
jgi:hypothetical protein